MLAAPSATALGDHAEQWLRPTVLNEQECERRSWRQGLGQHPCVRGLEAREAIAHFGFHVMGAVEWEDARQENAEVLVVADDQALDRAVLVLRYHRECLYGLGIVGTDMWVEIDKRFSELTGAPIGETYDKYVGGIALGRTKTPDDVAALVSYLAGPDSDYIKEQGIQRRRDRLSLTPRAGVPPTDRYLVIVR